MIPTRQGDKQVDQVSSLLHTLRGEEFRRRRNLLGARAHVPTLSSQRPSLPPLFANDLDAEGIQDPPVNTAPPAIKLAGPAPPRSWIPSGQSGTYFGTSEWRAHALSLVIKYAPSPSPALSPSTNLRIPSLFQLCLQNLLLQWGGIPPEIFPDLPRHILREYIRYSAVHAPHLPLEDLKTLWDVDDAASADGEIILSGLSTAFMLSRLSTSSTSILNDWDSPSDVDPDLPPALHTLIVLSSSFSSSLVSFFPATLTHLALLRISPIPLHTFPLQLPLIEFLDLSFNPWIGETPGRVTRVEWHKWMNLEVIGIRECGMSDEAFKIIEAKANRRRLKDVEIII